MKSPRLALTKDGNFNSPDDPGEKGYGGKTKRRSVTPEEAEILRDLSKGKRVLEIGTGLGVATRAMAETAQEVVSVDIDPWCHSFEFPENVRLLKNIPNEEFDLVFIDGHHSFDAVCADISNTKSPLVVLHDCYLIEVKRALEHMKLRVLEVFETRCELTLCSRL